MRQAFKIAVVVSMICSIAADQASAKMFDVVRTGVFALRTDLLMAALAKELCSCHFVARVGENRPLPDSISLCLERAQLPITPGLIEALTGVTIDDSVHQIEVDTTMLGAIGSLFMGDAALARYDPDAPQFGCRLMRD